MPRFTHKSKDKADLPDTVIPTNPKTGDETGIMLYLYLACGSLLGIVVILVLAGCRRKKDE